jgi:hypothetical protein
VDLILLPSNRPPDRFYRGGRKVTESRPQASGSRRTGLPQPRRLPVRSHSG